MIAETNEINLKIADGERRNEALKKELAAIKNARADLKKKNEAKKANNEKLREKIAKMAEERKKKEKKKKEIDEKAEILRVKVEKTKRENELKKMDLKPLESAISRKKEAIEAMKMDPIFNVSFFVDFKNLTLEVKMTNKLPLIFPKMVERSEAKSAKRSFASKYLKF